MLKRKNLAHVLVAMLLALPALAADRAGDLAIINTHTPKPGATAKYEAARVKHMAWHKAQKDPWSWLTWEIVSGDASESFSASKFSSFSKSSLFS